MARCFFEDLFNGKFCDRLSCIFLKIGGKNLKLLLINKIGSNLEDAGIDPATTHMLSAL